MTTLAALQRKTATLEQETRRLYPAPGPNVLKSWLDSLDGDEQDQARRFLESIEPHLSFRDNGSPDLTRLTDDELDELGQWVRRGKAREQGGSAE